MTTILGVKLSDRINSSQIFQKVLTDYGCIIKTRLGLHEAGDYCKSHGLIILELIETEQTKDFVEELRKLKDIKVGEMRI